MKELVLPSVNKFGQGALSEIIPFIKTKKYSKCVVITDHNLVQCGIFDKLKHVLEDGGIEYSLYDHVSPNPTKENVYEALELIKRSNADFIIGLGGGSPNDCAKAAGILATNGGKIEDYAGGNKSLHPSLPLIAVNTTAGTASEISRAYLISDEEKKEKIIAKDINAMPVCSINDPELMVGLPSRITASTGMDALSHAIESYVANNAYPLTRYIASTACRIIFKVLPEVISDPTNIELRDQMIYAEFTGGLAFCNSGVGIDHSLSHACGATYHLPHGLCCAIFLPPVIRYNMKTSEKEYAELAMDLFPDECKTLSVKGRAMLLASKVEELSEKVGTKVSLKSLGVNKEDFAGIANKALRDGNTARNPSIPTIDEFKSILEEVY